MNGEPYAEGASFDVASTPVKVIAIAPLKVTFEAAGRRFERELPPAAAEAPK